MKMRCFGCGVEKDTDVKEFSTSENLVKDRPIDPLFTLCCEGRDEHEGDWRTVVVCHGCCDRLEPDMWISSNCWKQIDPAIPFERLPEGHCGSQDPAAYAHLVAWEEQRS